MAEKASSKMSTAINWPEQIGVIAGPFKGNRKSWLSRAARLAGFNYRTVKALYYGESRNPRDDVATCIRDAVTKARIEEAKSDAAALAKTYQNAALALEHIDPDFHRHSIDVLVEAARIISGQSSPGTEVK